jgi:3-hydroxybutyryl-CoA dehydrogenase
VPEVRTIAVIGAGPAGQDIARLTALAGYRTILEDVLPSALRHAQDAIREKLAQTTATGHLTATRADAAFSRIEYASTIEDAVRQAELIIESVPDQLESKLEIFCLLDRMCRPGAILASNTRSFRISDITDVTFRREQCVGLRFCNSTDGDLRIEVVRGTETDDNAFSRAAEVAHRLSNHVLILDERDPARG